MLLVLMVFNKILYFLMYTTRVALGTSYIIGLSDYPCMSFLVNAFISCECCHHCHDGGVHYHHESGICMHL